MLVTLALTFVLNYVFSGQDIQFNQMIRAIQVVMHIPLLRVSFPPIVIMLFNILLPVITFDLYGEFEPLERTL
jgi:hypothetical protein